MFVMTSLVSELDPRKRVILFEHFVKIAVALRELKNFNGCLEIISGMHHSVWQRASHSLLCDFEYLLFLARLLIG